MQNLSGKLKKESWKNILVQGMPDGTLTTDHQRTKAIRALCENVLAIAFHAKGWWPWSSLAALAHRKEIRYKGYVFSWKFCSVGSLVMILFTQCPWKQFVREHQKLSSCWPEQCWQELMIKMKCYRSATKHSVWCTPKFLRKILYNVFGINDDKW